MAKQSALKRTATSRQTTAGAREMRNAAAAPTFDRLIHERLRLGIVSALAANESLTFSDLKSLVDSSDGNLSVHARKLEDAGYITCTKFFEGRVPKTEYKLTVAGRRALENYLNHMQALIEKVRSR